MLSEEDVRPVSPDSRIYYAHRMIDRSTALPLYQHASPDRWWVEIHGLDYPIVTICIRERVETDPSSAYWGWLDRKKPDRYIFVQPHEIMLDMCFPYGPKVEEERGVGRKVNLIVEEVP